MWWQAPEKPFTQLEAQRPQSSQACARPLDTNHANVQFCLFTPLPPSPSLFPSLSAFFPSLLALPLLFPLLHFDTPSLSKSLVVHLKSVFTAGQTVNLWNGKWSRNVVCARHSSLAMTCSCVAVLTWTDSWSSDLQTTQRYMIMYMIKYLKHRWTCSWPSCLTAYLTDWLTGCNSHF